MNNKNFRKELLSFAVIALQAVWLLFSYAQSTAFLDKSPKLCLPCFTESNTVSISVPLSPEFIGNSITWDSDTLLKSVLTESKKSHERCYSGASSVLILDEAGNDISAQYPKGVPAEAILPLPSPGDRPHATHFISFSDGSVNQFSHDLKSLTSAVSYWRPKTGKGNTLTFSHLEADTLLKHDLYQENHYEREMKYLLHDTYVFHWSKKLTLRRNGEKFTSELVFLIPSTSREAESYLSEKKRKLYDLWEETTPNKLIPSDIKWELIATPHKGKIIPIQLYVNGIPYKEALQKIKAGSFLPDATDTKS